MVHPWTHPSLEMARIRGRVLHPHSRPCVPVRTSRSWVHLGAFGLALLLVACGGDSDGGNPSPEPFVRTLVYAVTECQGDDQMLSGSQKFVIQRDGREVVVKEWHFPPLPAAVMPGVGLCHVFGFARDGATSATVYPVQRFAVSPDASTVVFEVTDDHSLYAPARLIPPEDEGFFVVNADGTGLRRLSDASREPCWRSEPDPQSPFGVIAAFRCWTLFFSPDGRKVAFTDMGPDETGQEGPQVFTMDVVTGERTQVTRLVPETAAGPVAFRVVARPWLEDGTTLRFNTNTEVDGFQMWTVKADGTEQPDKVPPEAVPEAIPGAVLTDEYRITPGATTVYRGVEDDISEIYVVARKDPTQPESTEELLQLTSFGRPDTGGGGQYLDADEQTVLFFASPDPFGTNPLENCQLFSINTLGGNLRQITQWDEGEHSPIGCTAAAGLSPDCRVDAFVAERGAGPDTVIFETSCDQFGKNLGSALFAIRSDGTGLRQLTHTRGASFYPDGTVSVELAGTWNYP